VSFYVRKDRLNLENIPPPQKSVHVCASVAILCVCSLITFTCGLVFLKKKATKPPEEWAFVTLEKFTVPKLW